MQAMHEEIRTDKLKVGEYIVNLGSILEIEEEELCFSMVIERMNQRQVFRFNKTDVLLIKKDALFNESISSSLSADTASPILQ